jgi:hypothetical protein
MSDLEAIPLFKESYNKWRKVAKHEALAKLLPVGMLSDYMADAKKKLSDKCQELLVSSQ